MICHPLSLKILITYGLNVLFNHTFYMNIYIYIKISYLQLSLGSSKAVLISKWNPTFLVSLKSIICWESKWEMVKTFVNNQFANKTNIQYILFYSVWFSLVLSFSYLFFSFLTWFSLAVYILKIVPYKTFSLCIDLKRAI